MFDVIPSIDVLEGRVVRLERGEAERVTVFSDDPVSVGIEWEGQGAKRLHIVDLDGALRGDPANREVFGGIIRRVAIPVQVAGGIRTLEEAERWLAIGADRVVLGTKALTDEVFLAEAVERFGFQLVVAPDASGREVRVEGWTQGTGEDVVDAARRLARADVPRLLVTDVAVDGMKSGPNVELLRDVASAGISVIASGGIASIDHLRAVSSIPGVEAAVVGRALYDGTLDLGDALKAVA